MNLTQIWFGLLLVSGAFAQTKAPPLPPAETYESSVEGMVLFPSAGDRSPVASVRAIRVRPTYFTSKSVTSSLRGTFRLDNLPAGEYVLCAGSSNPKFAESCFWFDGQPIFSLASGQKLSGQTVTLLAGRMVEVRLRDPSRLLSLEGSAPRSLVLQLHGPPGTAPRGLRAVRPESDGQFYRIVVPVKQPGSVVVSATGLVIGDEGGRELPAVGFSKALDSAVSAAPLQLEFRVLRLAAASPKL